MKLMMADKYLTDDILLYPMQGFYLLCVPLNTDVLALTQAYLFENCIVLCSDDIGLITPINSKVSTILIEQMALKADKPNVLGVITQVMDESMEIDAVNFVRYNNSDALSKVVSKPQIEKITKYNQSAHESNQEALDAEIKD